MSRRGALLHELVLAKLGLVASLEALFGVVPSRALRHLLYRRVLGLDLGPDAKLHRGATIGTARRVRIGRGSVVGQRAHIDGREGVEIGADVTLSSEVSIFTQQHDVQDADFAVVGAPVRIADRAWLSHRCVVLPGVQVGEGAVVAAGAVVTRDVPAHTMVGGVPAKPIHPRTTELSYELGRDRAPWFV